MKIIRIFFCLMLFVGCNKNDDDSCNGESVRRDVKIAIDDLASEIDTVPIITSIDSIGSISLKEAHGDTERLEIEKKTFQVTGLVHKVSHHKDGDYKVKLISDNEKYLNCEIPNPNCPAIATSLFLPQILLAREFIETNHKTLEGKIVTITGVAFIDIDHKYPRNTSDNEIEIHPVLAIKF